MNPLELNRAVLVATLGGATILTALCPCGSATTGEGLLGCHFIEIMSLLGASAIFIIYINRNSKG